MKKKNAYFTVEAALVLPLAMGVILFAVYILMFQYNRCLSEQDAGTLAMWGSTLSGDVQTLEAQMQKRLAEVYREKYVAWEMQILHLEVKNNTCSVAVAGQLRFPVPGWNFWNKENVWNAETTFAYKRLQPVEFVRMCNKLVK